MGFILCIVVEEGEGEEEEAKGEGEKEGEEGDGGFEGAEEEDEGEDEPALSGISYETFGQEKGGGGTYEEKNSKGVMKSFHPPTIRFKRLHDPKPRSQNDRERDPEAAIGR